MENPRPAWVPACFEDVDTIMDRGTEYTSKKRALVVFRHGSVVFSDSALHRADADYVETLKAVVDQSPDFSVIPMKDGNYVVRFAGPVIRVVITGFFAAHREEIQAGIEFGGLLPGEQLIVPAELKVPVEHYFAGLYARAKLYGDVEKPDIVRRFAP